MPHTTPPAPHVLAFAALFGLSVPLSSMSMLQFGTGNISGSFNPANFQAVCCAAAAALNSKQATKPAAGVCS